MSTNPIRSFRRTFLVAAILTASMPTPAAENASMSIDAGLTWVLRENTRLDQLVIDPGAYVMAGKGYSVTMTVDGVETSLEAGVYKGDIRLTVTEQETVSFAEDDMRAGIRHDFRQAIYLDENGINEAKSVLDAAGDYNYEDGTLSGFEVQSRGHDFNGIYATGGRHLIKGGEIKMHGRGGDDFAGYGAALMSSGKNTRLVVDGINIETEGAVRTAAVAEHGSNLIVKNSRLVATGGPNAPEYIPNVGVGTMKHVPWMLGLVGNNRATNLLGDDTVATYINSYIESQDWGVLSVDMSQNAFLASINSDVIISGKSGYATYAIGNSTNTFLGTHIEVPDYSAIVTGGNMVYDDSSAANVRKYSEAHGLGLTSADIRSIEERPTTVESDRFGIMIWGRALVDIRGGTTFDTDKATFLVKGTKATINVDGSNGVRLSPKNGILLQLMETDNPGASTVNGLRLVNVQYYEPQDEIVKNADFDVTAIDDTSVQAKFSNIELQGNLYNSSFGECGYFTSTSGYPGEPLDRAPCTKLPGRNLAVSLKESSLEGVVSATTAKHRIQTITPLEWYELGEVTNTPGAVVNNGVILSLEDSDWTVTGTSYLSSLIVDAKSSVKAPTGKALSVTVDGNPVSLEAGSYTGDIVVGLR